MDKKPEKGETHRYRRMTPGDPRRTLGISIATERNLAALTLLQHGHAAIGETLTVNPLVSARGSLRVPDGDLLEVLTPIAQQRSAALDILSSSSTSSVELHLINEIRSDVEIQTIWNTEGRLSGPRRAPGRRDPLPPREAEQPARDRKAPAPLLLTKDTPGVIQPYEIDLLVFGLLEYHGVDIDALSAELDGHAARTQVDLASPSARSNHAIALESLGYSFPPAIFRLRGRSLDTLRMAMEASDGQGSKTTWHWSAGHAHQGGPTLRADGLLPRLDLYRTERASLSAVLDEPSIHPSLRIARALRFAGEGNSSSVTIEMHRRSVPLLSSARMLPERLEPATQPVRLPVWLEPEEDSIENAKDTLLRLLSARAGPYRYDAETRNDHVELILSAKPECEQKSPSRNQVGHRYRFVQEDFVDEATTREALKRTLDKHGSEVQRLEAIRLQMEKEVMRRRDEAMRRREKARKLLLAKEKADAAARKHASAVRRILDLGQPDNMKEEAYALDLLNGNPTTPGLRPSTQDRLEEDQAIAYAVAGMHCPLIEHLGLLRQPWMKRARLEIAKTDGVAHMTEMAGGPFYYRHKRIERKYGFRRLSVGMLIIRQDPRIEIRERPIDELIGKQLSSLLPGIGLPDGVEIFKAAFEDDRILLGLSAMAQLKESKRNAHIAAGKWRDQVERMRHHEEQAALNQPDRKTG